MAEVVMYGTRFCPYCVRARMLLEDKGVPYTDIRVDGDVQLRREMEEKSGRYTVPQIFIDGVPIGGFTDMLALERRGDLNRMLGLEERESP